MLIEAVASDHGVRNIRQALASPHSALFPPVRRGRYIRIFTGDESAGLKPCATTRGSQGWRFAPQGGILVGTV